MTQELTVVKKQEELLAPTKEDYKEMQVGEPTNMLEARALAAYLAKSKLLPPSLRGDIPTAMTLIITCKQYGLPVTALNEAQEINGKVGFWGRTKLGIILRNPVCEYLMTKEKTDKKCVVVAKRKGWPKEVEVEYTIEDARQAGLLVKDNWKKHPKKMLYWRAITDAITEVFPDICQGMTIIEEEEETPQAEAVAMPKEIEMPKPKRTRRVKAVAEDSSAVEEDKLEATILPPVEEMATYDEVEILEESAKEDPKIGTSAPSVPSGVVVGVTPQRYLRFIKQVFLENGERYVLAQNPIASLSPSDKWLIPTAGMASELKKMTGMKAYLFVMGGKVVNYEEYPEA